MSGFEIHSPAELRALDVRQLEELAQDLRQIILETCLKNGGHLGASLGAVELAIALHATFESPREALVWDVGHQAYAHKLLTGRWERFATLRKTGGISGFLSREESPHDVFGAGHSSTALSAALAIAWSKGRASRREWTVAVVGDGGLTAGLAFEALNNARGAALGPLLVVLNDNQMSISENVGAISALLAEGRARELFELFGFEYVGPVNGHDLPSILAALGEIRSRVPDRPILLHVLTQKGKGYAPAEERPDAYHGVSPIPAKLSPPGVGAPKEISYSEAFGRALVALAEKDPRVVAITAAMPEGTGLTEFARRFPERFFDVGIAEPHAVTFAAGLATQGYRPVVAIYSTFLQRSVDEIIHDVALQNLPVVFAIDRAGIVGADGPTHHGAFDLAYMGMTPRMRVLCPASREDLPQLLAEALRGDGPCAIRYPRGAGAASLGEPLQRSRIRFRQAAQTPELIVVALGAIAPRAFAASRAADTSGARISSLAVVDAKPIPQELIDYLNQLPRAQLITLEEGSTRGAFGQALAAFLEPRADRPILLGYGDHFIPHGAPADLEEQEGLSEAALKSRFSGILAARESGRAP